MPAQADNTRHSGFAQPTNKKIGPLHRANTSPFRWNKSCMLQGTRQMEERVPKPGVQTICARTCPSRTSKGSGSPTTRKRNAKSAHAFTIAQALKAAQKEPLRASKVERAENATRPMQRAGLEPFLVAFLLLVAMPLLLVANIAPSSTARSP